MGQAVSRRPLTAHRLAAASRTHVTTCTCGEEFASATEAGLEMLAEHHLRTLGIWGHRITLARKASPDGAGATAPSRTAAAS